MTLLKTARAAKLVDSTPGAGNLVRVIKPAALSLVGLPANQTGFKVVREDTTQKEPAMSSKQIIRRTRRSDTSPIIALTFPEGSTETDVSAALESYGMSGYTIKKTGDLYQALRSDLKSISKDGTIDIRLNEAGVMATVTRQDGMNPIHEGDKPGIALASLEFDMTKFDQAQVTEWLQRNSVDSTGTQTENSENACVVRRSAVPDTEETRRLQLEDGVTAVLVRADVYDIPDGFYAVVNEYAYGNWGWGQLDFTATMADEEFSEHVRNAVSKLEDVLRNILYWSPLPLDVRKTLMTNSLTQFGAYVEALMDSLPRQLLVSVVRSAQPQLEKEMTEANKGGAPSATPAQTPAMLTREDIAAAVAEAVKPLAERLEKVERADPAKPAEPATTVVTEPAPAGVVLTRADVMSAMTEVVKPLADRMDALEGTTIVRAAPGDAAVTPVDPAAAASKLAADKKDGTIFRGALGLTGRKTA